MIGFNQTSQEQPKNAINGRHFGRPLHSRGWPLATILTIYQAFPYNSCNN